MRVTVLPGSGCGTRGRLRFFRSNVFTCALSVCPRVRQVNPALYSAFRMPGSVEYEDGKPVLYGANAEETPPQSCLKPGQRCPGFRFNPHRECERGMLPRYFAVTGLLMWLCLQGGQQPEQLEQVQEFRVQVQNTCCLCT
jgi:hypothetical protein